jgi:hypothetical protein
MKRLILSLALLVVSTSAFAQVQYRGSAKFVCGRADQASIDAYAFSPGVYYTSLNVTNPDDQEKVVGRKRFSVARLAQHVGPWTGWVAWTLGPGQSMQVDCSDIYAQLNIPVGTFIDGFVHFAGDPVRYDVTGVYTVSNGAMIINQDVEEVTIRP